MHSLQEAVALARSGWILRHPAAPLKRLYVNPFGMLVHAEPDAGFHRPFRPTDGGKMAFGWERL